jgi:hypothetical protein
MPTGFTSSSSGPDAEGSAGLPHFLALGSFSAIREARPWGRKFVHLDATLKILINIHAAMHLIGQMEAGMEICFMPASRCLPRRVIVIDTIIRLHVDNLALGLACLPVLPSLSI